MRSAQSLQCSVPKSAQSVSTVIVHVYMHVQFFYFDILKQILHISVEFSNNSMINFYVQKGTFQILRIRKVRFRF